MNRSYSVAGPLGYALSKEQLFEKLAVNASDVTFRIKIVPRMRQLVHVDQESGDIVISPQQVHTDKSYTVTLLGDTGTAQAELKQWKFSVRLKPTFKVAAYTRYLSNGNNGNNGTVLNVTARAIKHYTSMWLASKVWA